MLASEGSRWVKLACKPLDTGGPLCIGTDTPILQENRYIK